MKKGDGNNPDTPELGSDVETGANTPELELQTAPFQRSEGGIQRTPPPTTWERPSQRENPTVEMERQMTEMKRELETMKTWVEQLKQQNIELREERENHRRNDRRGYSEEIPHGTGFRLPKGGWLTNPFGDLKYHGKKDELNPVRFLNRFERIAEREQIPEEDLVHYFTTCLKGSAAAWSDNREFVTFGEARTAFLDHFWDSVTQSQIRYKIYTGKYIPSKDGTMVDYALKLSRQAKALTAPMEEKEIVTSIARGECLEGTATCLG